ncbi:MAG TPA: hypothetical protein VM347_19145, partial [Nonomuraea sp.]|nr:hypothetical protein [Nonomuraea sp.]
RVLLAEVSDHLRVSTDVMRCYSWGHQLELAVHATTHLIHSLIETFEMWHHLAAASYLLEAGRRVATDRLPVDRMLTLE